MFSYRALREIAASPDVVWSVLTDTVRLQSGGFGIVKIEGAMIPGGRIKVFSELDPKRAFPVTVAKMEAPGLMVWEGGMPFGLFRGVRTFKLTATVTGTSFEMEEVFSGPLAGLMRKAMPDLQPIFDKFADGLKVASESA